MAVNCPLIDVFILTARSEVFPAMFQHPMEKQSTNVAKIEDIDPDVFQQMLCYIYTGQVWFGLKVGDDGG